MNIYRIGSEPDFQEEHRISFEPENRWGLPGVSCPHCQQTWAMVGMYYPWISLENLSDLGPYLDPWPVALDRWVELRDIVRPYVPSALPLLPGTRFGLTLANLRGNSKDFLWDGNWEMYVSAEFLLRLQGKIAFPNLTEMYIKQRRTTISSGFFEVGIDAFARIAEEGIARTGKDCTHCGREGVRLIEPVLIGESIPKADFFRASNVPTQIFVTEHVAESLLQLDAENIQLTPVRVV